MARDVEEILEGHPLHEQQCIEGSDEWESSVYLLNRLFPGADEDTEKIIRAYGAGLTGFLAAVGGAYALSTQITDKPGWQAVITVAGIIPGVIGYTAGGMFEIGRQEYKEGLQEQVERSIPYARAVAHKGIALSHYSPWGLMSLGNGPTAKHALIKTPGDDDFLLVNRNVAKFLGKFTYNNKEEVNAVLPRRCQSEKSVIDNLVKRDVLAVSNEQYNAGDAFAETATVALRFTPLGARQSYYVGLGNTTDD